MAPKKIVIKTRHTINVLAKANLTSRPLIKATAERPRKLFQLRFSWLMAELWAAIVSIVTRYQ
jgi:hypothetical protein